MQAAAQLVAHQRPDLLDGVLTGDFLADLSVGALWTGAGAFTGNGEAVLQDQHTECQQTKALGVIVIFPMGCKPDQAILGREIVLTGDIRLDVRRRDARRGHPLGLDFLLNGLIFHG